MISDYYELKVKINPEISDPSVSEILSNICFENLPCEGVVLAEEEYKDDLVLVSTTEGTFKAFLKVLLPSPLVGEGGQSPGEGLNLLVTKTLHEQKNLLLQRGFSVEELGSWDFEISKVENQDWSKKWKENWDVTLVSEKIAVVPSWLEYSPKEGEIVINLDPGTAFGTGTHPTTQLCMLAIEKYLKPNDKMADIGTGSGILAVCGIKFGAKSAYACDNDDLVIETAKENAELNAVGSKCHFECNTADKVSEKFDFITANILHNVLAEIMGDLKALMNDGAKLVLSGIMDDKKQVVLDAIKKYDLKIIEEMQQDDWVAFVVRN